MRRIGFIATLVFTGLIAVVGSQTHAQAQEFPTHVIRIVTLPAGGGADFGARLIAQGLSEELHQQVIVENRANGPIASEVVKDAAPDGYTLLYQGSAQWLYPFMVDKPSYDPVKDYAAVAVTSVTPSILVVNPSVQATTVKELIALAKAKPGALNFGSGGAGSSYHLAGELFKYMAGIDIVHVPYGGGGPATLGVVKGETQILFATGGSIFQLINTNKVRALAVSSSKPSPLAPGLPTVAEAALPGYESVNFNVMFAPAKTPPAIVAKLNDAVNKALKRPELRDKFVSSGAEPLGGPPGELTRVMTDDMDRMSKVIKEAHIRAD